MNNRDGKSNFNIFLIIAALIIIIFVIYYFYYQPSPDTSTMITPPVEQTTPASPGPGPNGPTPREVNGNQPAPTP